MTWGRAVIITALTLVLGLGLGVAVERTVRTDPALVSARPIIAESPSAPAMTVLRTLPDPKAVPMSQELEYRRATVGAEPFLISLEVPADWEEIALEAAEKKWVPPGRPEDTFFMRVEKVASQRQTVTGILASRLVALSEAPGILDLQVLERTSTTLTLSYINERQRRRLQIIRWTSPGNSGMAEVELVVNGRMVDRPGLEALLERVDGSLRA